MSICKYCGAEGVDHDYQHLARECYPAQINAKNAEIERLRGAAQAQREPIAWLDVRTAGLSWQNRIIATNPQFVENNGPENFVALYASPLPSTHRESDELSEWKQAASVEAGLRREFMAQVDAAREFVKRHPALTLIDLAEFEAFLKVPAMVDAAFSSTHRSGGE